MIKVLHLTTHLNIGGITSYILKLVKPMRQHGIEISVLSSGGEWSHLFDELNVPTYQLSIKTKSELSLKIYAALPALIRLIKKDKIQVMHAHTRVTQILAFWASRFTGIPFVTTCHGFYKRRLGRRLLPAWGDCAIGISEGVSEHLMQDFHLPPEKVCTVYNGVDIQALDESYGRQDALKAKQKFGFKANNEVVGDIARLVADKGQEYLIQAVHKLKDRFPNIRLLLVGDGNDRAHLEQLTRELKIENQVVFTGSVADITEPLVAMDVFAFPAVWREGFGLSIIEAMACRKAIIATKNWKLSSRIQEGVSGMLVEIKKVEPLVENITLLLSNPELRHRMGMEARKVVEQDFSIERMAKELAAIYQRLASGEIRRNS